ncbi:calcium-activated potassium channel subunit beta-2 isoform X2 [Callorhinchus milii]|uniref:Potassium large conductance calcium-activated channel, subfamily M, beta member 2a n=2 Tax=Callorhinchus milii TaxID=7868 RepID=A0A4W3GK05_CALMI|nr:calcium-activated potassium channel subunit beta-2 isoform X2 [Callorhinchus milii]|eukprot:gi/632934960/ref/XP_007887166.1/ PREDICTED: calcium-activated potassium channel subunit beta-2 isoform X2 [Callorhinchus milii]
MIPCRSWARQGTRSGSGLRMFLWATPRASSQSTEHQGRSFYKKLRAYDILDKRKTDTALKAGEDRAMFLGLGMMVCSVMMCFLLGITMIQSPKESAWKEKSQCVVLEANITDRRSCTYSCGEDCHQTSDYPCLQVYVNLLSSGQRVLLHHTEETVLSKIECFYVPKCKKNSSDSEILITAIRDNFTKFQVSSLPFPCYYDPDGRQKNVLLTRLKGPNAVFHTLFWPLCLFVGGTLIVVMVKLTQYLSLLNEQFTKNNK